MSKYHSCKTTIDGYTFDSKKEAHRYMELKEKEAAGTVRNIELQKVYELIPSQPGERACRYKADFTYEELICGRWETIVEDVKGVRTDVYKIKRKLMLWVHGIRIREI